MSKDREKISVFIVTFNEERNIRRCLESVKFCDEIIVVDSGSGDQTVEIARSYGAKVIERAWPGFVEQKRFALEQCQHEWVLNLDADEELSPELSAEIKGLLSASNQALNGYQISRLVYFLGRWWKRGGWYPEYRLRLMRRVFTTWGGIDPHERAIVSGQIGYLKAHLHHYTYSGLSQQIQTLNRYSDTAAEQMFKQGRKTNLFEIFTRPIIRFIKFYFIKLGFLEGIAGLIVALNESFYVFLKYSKLWAKKYDHQDM